MKVFSHGKTFYCKKRKETTPTKRQRKQTIAINFLPTKYENVFFKNNIKNVNSSTVSQRSQAIFCLASANNKRAAQQ